MEPQPQKLIIAEDDKLTAQIWCNVLRSAYYDVEIVSEGDKVIPRITETKAVGLVLDVMIPVIDGLTVLKTIRSTPALQSLPVLVVTNAFVPELVQRAKAAGADLIIGKDTITSQELKEFFRKALTTRKAA
jgi:CheY-like chemotaxis protein